MSKIRKMLQVIGIFTIAALLFAGTSTTYLNLYKPASGEANWGTAYNSNFDLIDGFYNTYTGHLGGNQHIDWTAAPTKKIITGQFTASGALNSDWISIIENTGATNAHALLVNIGADSTGIPIGVTKDNSAWYFIVDTSGNVGIGTYTTTAKLDINSDILRLRTAKTPASSAASGNAGDLCSDSSYLYRHDGSEWKRIAWTTF